MYDAVGGRDSNSGGSSVSFAPAPAAYEFRFEPRGEEKNHDPGSDAANDDDVLLLLHHLSIRIRGISTRDPYGIAQPPPLWIYPVRSDS